MFSQGFFVFYLFLKAILSPKFFAKKYFLDKKDDTLKDLANNLAMTVITRDILSDIFETITSKIESRENFTPLLDLVVVK